MVLQQLSILMGRLLTLVYTSCKYLTVEEELGLLVATPQITCLRTRMQSNRQRLPRHPRILQMSRFRRRHLIFNLILAVFY